jgi:hypothetical protein
VTIKVFFSQLCKLCRSVCARNSMRKMADRAQGIQDVLADPHKPVK